MGNKLEPENSYCFWKKNVHDKNVIFIKLTLPWCLEKHFATILCQIQVSYQTFFKRKNVDEHKLN